MRRLPAPSLVLIAALAPALPTTGCSGPAAPPHTAYVSDEQADVVHVIDGASARKVSAIAVGKRPRGMRLSGDGKRLYVAASNDDRVEVIDLASRRVVDRIPTGPDPERFSLSPDGA